MTEHPTGSERRTLGALLLLALVAHAPGLAGAFVYDDHRFVENNGALAQTGPWQLLTDAATHTADSDRDVYRPLRALGHAWDLSRWGLEPFGFHLHSLAVHLISVVLAWLVLCRWFPATNAGPALFGTLALAIHPLGVEAVDWISSRGDLYAVMFGLGALLALGRSSGRQPAGPASRASDLTLLAAGSGLVLLATLGKESAAALVGVLLLARFTGRARWRDVGAAALGVGLALTLRQVVLSGLSPVQTTPHGGTVVSQAGWALFGIGRTLEHLVWPLHLAVDYPQHEWAAAGSPWASPYAWVALAALLSPLVLLRRRPALALAAGWLMLAYLPSSSLTVTLRSLVADRYAYPILVPFGALLGLGLSARWPRGALLALAAALSLWWIPTTIDRTAVFRDDGSLWRDVLAGNPGSVPAHIGLAAVSNDPAVQTGHYADAARLAPEDTWLQGWALARLGEQHLRAARNPTEAMPMLARGLYLLRRHRDRPEAPAPEEFEASLYLAESLALLGRHEDAEQTLGEALSDHATESMRVRLLTIKRAQLAMHHAMETRDAPAWAHADSALRVAESLAATDPLVLAMRRTWLEAPRQDVN